MFIRRHPYIFRFFLAWLCSAGFLFVTAQKIYTANDSLHVQYLLNKSQLYIDNSILDSALNIAKECLTFSTDKNYVRGKVYAHNKIGDIYYQLSDIDQMVHHDSIAMSISQNIKDDDLLALSCNHLGIYFSEKGDKATAEKLFSDALRLERSSTLSPLYADVYNNMGYLYGLQGEINTATDYYFKSLNIYEKLNDKHGQAKVLDNLAGLFYSIGKYDNSISYQLQCINIRRNTNDHYGLAVAYSNISQMYLAIDSLDDAFRYQQLGMTNAQASGSKKLIAQSHIALGLLYNSKGDNQKSLIEELKAIKILEGVNDQGMLSRRYISAGTLYDLTGDSVNAIEYLGKAVLLSEQLHNPENLRDAYYHLTIVYKVHKDFYNAYENLKKYYRYRDSIINEETLSKVADIQTKYETEKKDAQIKQLSSEQTIQQLELEKQKAVIKGNLLLAKEKQNEIDLLTQTRELQDLKIKKQEEDLYKEKIQAQVNEQKRKLAEQEKQIKEKQLQNETLLRNVMIAGFLAVGVFAWILFSRYQLKKKLEQNNLLLSERSRISSELHDEVGSTLSTINILSHSARSKIQTDTNKSSELLEKINDNSQRMMDAMSDIVWSISPNNDDLLSLLVRMKEFAAEMLESKNINYAINIQEDLLQLKLSPAKRRDIYLIFKEAVNNIAKYSNASNASVNITKTESNIAMQINDDGKGFDIASHKHGNGLSNMQKRVQQHNGEWKLNTEKNKGTSIHLTMPIA